ncbi:transglutaminase-like domain-containing protein [Acidovorax sp.]|uniref:transglutaminase-like domain-containing protein n=1 Tax=Acidovorax sp. TaxID=1872122 RepID=UPI00262045FD|nr:transglutaminase-like domain-containing protein [Acidovorax sp.]
MPALDTLGLLRQTPILDHTHPSIQALIQTRGWRALPERERIGAIYDFVRDEIAFGYNLADDLPASRVLEDGIGQCNTKGTLFMALLRACGIPCRLHGFTIDKALQKGAITGIAYHLAPRSIVHSWVEVWFEGRWLELEGFILDTPYLRALQQRFAAHRGAFCGYGAATPDLQRPEVEWRGGNTYIQKDGINHDFGVFNDPDAFYAQHGVNLGGLKRWLFQTLVRNWMNRNVARIRRGGGGAVPPCCGSPLEAAPGRPHG